MTKVITYGTFDLLHYGHINLLKNAKKLGDFLIVGVTSDEFDRARGKINVVQSLTERIAAIEATGLADQIIVEEYQGQKVDDILRYNVDIFAIGSDWEGSFDYLKRYCKVVYLPRTNGISSTQQRFSQEKIPVNLGIIGTQNPSERLISECKTVQGIKLCGIYGEQKEEAERISRKHNIPCFYDNLEDLYQSCNAVYIKERIDLHADIIRDALHRGKHVLCESPIFLNVKDAEECYKYAQENKLVLMEAVKTRYFPAYQHMILLLESGIIGEIKDIEVTFSQRLEGIEYSSRNRYEGGLFDLGGYLFLPIIQLLGRDIKKTYIFTNKENNFDVYVKGLVKYSKAIATFCAGVGVKSENQMIITGTDGYVYVPAPWWKTDYFEIRYEDLRKTKKYFWQYEGEGFRYEIAEFVRRINDSNYFDRYYTEDDSMVITSILEAYDHGDYESF